MAETLLNTKQIYASQPLYKAYTTINTAVTVSDNNIASGFISYGNDNSNNSYLLINKEVPSGFSIFEFDVEFTCGNFNRDVGYSLLVGNNETVDLYVQGNPSDSNNYRIYRWNGSSNPSAGPTALAAGGTYQARYVMNYKNNTESAYILVNGEWVQQWSVTPSTNWLQYRHFGIGGSYKYENAWDSGGTINLNKTAIYIDGECFFNGAKNWVPSTAALTAVTGFDASKQQTLQNDNGTLKWVDNA